MRASVVVPTYNRPDLLGRCLDALAAQDLDPASFEVVVADDAACPATRGQVEGRPAAAGPSVLYVAVTGTRGPAGARNAGWRQARGEVVAFTDDDCVPERGWLRAGLAAFESDPGLAAVTGRVVVPRPDPPTDYERDAAGLEGSEFVTANCFCRRDVLERVGGFDERFAAAWREDSDLHFRLLKGGGRIGKADGAVVVHPVRPARWGVSVGQQRKSQFDALLFKKHPALFRRRIRRLPPWDYYAAVGSLGAIPLGLWLGPPWLAAASASVWAALTTRFCARRLRDTTRAPGHVAEMVATSVLIPPVAFFWRLYGALRFRTFFL
jgi:GT2 family glycosyltransferase